MKLLFGLALFALAVLPAAARVAFDASVQDDAVVQRGKPWRVGGSTDSTAAVVLRVDGRRVETMPRDGRWSVEASVPESESSLPQAAITVAARATVASASGALK